MAPFDNCEKPRHTASVPFETSFQSLCRAPEIGANSYCLQLGGHRLILDSGLHPKQQGEEAIPRIDEIEPDSADAIFVSHAHLDHIGTIPLAQKSHPHARVYMTPEVANLAEALLHNSVNVMTSQSEELNIAEYPLFTHGDLDELCSVWQGMHYRKPFHPLGSDLEVTFRDAGHVLGSAGMLFEGGGKRIFYTGDVQFKDQSLISKADFSDLGPLDALVVETTRGSKEPVPNFDRDEEVSRLIENLAETIDRGGSALIPVFAMGKTQEVLTMIQNAKEDGTLPDAPVTIGGLSTKMTVIYDRYASNENRRRPDFRILKDMELRAGTRRRGGRVPIRYQAGAIYALSSGMMSENTVSNQFARGFLPNPLNSLHLVGYSDPSTPSYRIRNASSGDLIKLDEIRDPVQLECQVEEYDFSGHANRDELLEFIIETDAPRVFLVHGDTEASQWFKEQLAAHRPNCEVIIPEPLQEYPF